MCIRVFAQPEITVLHSWLVYTGVQRPPPTRLDLSVPIASAELGLRESSDRSLLAQLITL